MTEQKSVRFKAKLKSGDGMHVLYKDDGRMLIWGPASVEIVDKENDRITTEALKDALPQLMRRQRLSLEHSDQLIGDIKKEHSFEEAKTVEIEGNEFQLKTFPTAVLTKDDGVPEDGLYVAGEVWSDTKQAAETQKDIEQGVIDSYSISGEAIESSTRVKDDRAINDIERMDLSAVTLCEEGMNQKSKFAVIKSGGGANRVEALAKEALLKSMSEDEDGEGGVGDDDAIDNVSDGFTEKELKSMFREAASDVVKDHLPDGDLATKDDIRDDATLQEKFNEWSGGSEEEQTKEDEESDDDVPDDIPVDDDDDDEEEKAVSDGPGELLEAARTVASAHGVDVEKVLEGFEVEEKEELPLGESLAGDDEEEEDELPDLDDEEMPEDDPEEPELDDEDVEPEDVEPEEDDVELSDSHSLDLDTLKSELPEDLYGAVTDHLSAPSGGSLERSEEEDDGEPAEKEEPAEEPDEPAEGEVSKAAAPGSSDHLDDYFAEISGVGRPDADDNDLQKSFDGEDVEVEESEGNLADQFLETQHGAN